MNNSNINKRIREIRDSFHLNQRDFAKQIDVGSSTLAMFETGARIPKDIHINRICSEFNINKNWLKTGEGKMFNHLPEDDEVAIYVSDLLEETNPFYDLILDIMKSYQKLDPKSKEVIHQMSENLVEISTERRK